MDILETPGVKEVVKHYGLDANPVYVGLARSLEKARDALRKSGNMTPVIFSCLDASLLPNPVTKKVERLHSKKGVDVFHQAIIMHSTVQAKMHREKRETLTQQDQDKILKEGEDAGLINPTALSAFSSIPATFNHPMAPLNHLLPVPLKSCEYYRLSQQAKEYVLSLGMPSREVLTDFYEYLSYKARVNGGFYEAILQLTVNNRPSYIYYCFTNGMFLALRYSSKLEDYEFCCDFDDRPQPMDKSLDDTLDTEEVLEVRGLLVNIWASEITKNFEHVSEPTEFRTAMNQVVPTKKANFNSYRYVKITPDGEEKLKESKAVAACARTEATYRKSVWFTRAYYARRGTDKTVTYCKASMHHRRCADVVDTPQVNVYI